MMSTLNNLLAQYQAASVNYAIAIRPYALHLFFALFTLDVLVTAIQYLGDGQLDPQYFLGRLLRHALGGGFTLAMIIHAPQWMGFVIQGFSQIGARISGVALDPDGIVKAGISMGGTLMNSPAGTGLISSVGMALIAAVIALIIVVSFVAAALELFLTLVFAYLGIALGVMLLAFGGLRFTAPFSEGYFQSVIRSATKLLFIYAVLGIGMQIAHQWNTALLAACKPVETAVPWIASYSTPPSSMIITVCTGSITVRDMFGYLAMALVFVACVIAIPRMAANLVGGSVGRGLEHVTEAFLIGRAVSGAMKWALGGSKGPSGASAGAAAKWAGSPAAQQFAAQVAAKAQQSGAAAPKALDPFIDPSKPPGYNYRGPSSPLPAGPGLPPPNGGSGSGGAALEYQPGRPGNYTRDIAVDVTDQQQR
jgi:type IV secretion system protein TrbL